MSYPNNQGFNNPNQGQFNPQQQGNFGGGQQNNFQGGQQGGGNAQSNKAAFSNHIEVQLVAYLTQDPASKPVGNGGKVASTSVAINHRGSKQGDDPDFWNLEVWVNQGQNSATHDFLTDYCKKGRQVFVTGTPYLKKTAVMINNQPVLNANNKPVYTYYPTIRVKTLVAVGGDGGNAGQSQGQQQQGQNFGGQQQQNQGQQNFGGQPQGQQQNFGGQPQGNFGGQPQGNFGGQPQGNFGAPGQGAPGGFGAPQGQFQGSGR